MSEENLENESKDTDVKIMIRNQGVKSGLICLFVGLLVIAFNYIMIEASGKYFVKLTAMGFVLFYAGLGMLLAPGKMEVEDDVAEKNNIKIVFKKSGVLTKVIWIVYAIAGIAACIYSVVCKYWDDVIALFEFTVSFTALLFVIKYIFLFIKNPNKKNIDEDYNAYVKNEEVKKSYYYQPARHFCILYILIFGIISFFTATSFYDNKFAESKDFTFNRDIKFDHVLVENLYKEVPVRFITNDYSKISIVINEDDLVLWDKYSEDDNYELSEEEMLNCVFLPLSSIIRHLAGLKVINDFARDSVFKVDTLYVVGTYGDYGEYNFKNLKRIPEIKEFLKENPPEIYDNLLITMSGTKFGTDFFKENYNKLCVFTIPELDSEYLYLWDLESFVNYININYPSNATTVDDIYFDFMSGYYDDTSFGIRELSELLEYFTDDYFENNGFIINYSFDEPYFMLHSKIMSLIDEVTPSEEESEAEEEAEL